MDSRRTGRTGSWQQRSAAQIYDGATGKIIAESNYFEPLSTNGLTPPGFGGRVYFPTAVGTGFYVLQVMPKRSEQRSKD